MNEINLSKIVENIRNGLSLLFTTENIIRMLIYIIAAVCIGYGIYMVLLYMSMLPTRKSEQILARVNKLDTEESQTTINKLLGNISKKIVLNFVQ